MRRRAKGKDCGERRLEDEEYEAKGKGKKEKRNHVEMTVH